MDFFTAWDYPTLTYLGYSLAALGAMGYAYYMTKGGVPQLKLTQDDLELIAKGVVKGAFHQEHLDDILQCVEDPRKTILDIEEAIKGF